MLVSCIFPVKSASHLDDSLVPTYRLTPGSTFASTCKALYAHGRSSTSLWADLQVCLQSPEEARSLGVWLAPPALLPGGARHVERLSISCWPSGAELGSDDEEGEAAHSATHLSLGDHVVMRKRCLPPSLAALDMEMNGSRGYQGEKLPAATGSCWGVVWLGWRAVMSQSCDSAGAPPALRMLPTPSFFYASHAAALPLPRVPAGAYFRCVNVSSLSRPTRLRLDTCTVDALDLRPLGSSLRELALSPGETARQYSGLRDVVAPASWAALTGLSSLCLGFAAADYKETPATPELAQLAALRVPQLEEEGATAPGTLAALTGLMALAHLPRLQLLCLATSWRVPPAAQAEKQRWEAHGVHVCTSLKEWCARTSPNAPASSFRLLRSSGSALHS